MSDVMLIGVLRMPSNMWSDDPLDIVQRHSRYVQAADRIESDAQEIDQLKAEVEVLEHKLNESLNGDHAALKALIIDDLRESIKAEFAADGSWSVGLETLDEFLDFKVSQVKKLSEPAAELRP